MKVDEIALPGVHNLENILSAMAAAKLTGVSNDAIQTVLRTYTWVKHRLQYVTESADRKL
jgi:UDP-N-acetylmuramoylalanine--D-glutamate ligase